MKTVKLEVQSRDNGTSAKELRRNNIIPAVFYGQGEESVPVQMDYQTFRRVYMQTGSSQLIDLTVDGKDMKKVLVHDMQLHPLAGTINHVDFLMVNLKEAINATIPISYEGEPPAVKDFGGVLNTVKTELHVKCLPLDLPHEIVVDITVLEELGSSLHVSDLTPPEGVELLDGEVEVLIIVNAPRAEEEPETVEGEGAVGEAGAAGEEEEGTAEGEGEKSEGGEGGEESEDKKE